MEQHVEQFLWHILGPSAFNKAVRVQRWLCYSSAILDYLESTCMCQPQFLNWYFQQCRRWLCVTCIPIWRVSIIVEQRWNRPIIYRYVMLIQSQRWLCYNSEWNVLQYSCSKCVWLNVSSAYSKHNIRFSIFWQC